MILRRGIDRPRTTKSTFATVQGNIFAIALVIVVCLMTQYCMAQETALRPLYSSPQPFPIDQVTQDPNGLATLQQAIVAFGGAAFVKAADGALINGTYSGLIGNGSFRWVDSGWEFRSEYKESDSMEWTNTQLSGHGNGSMQAGTTQYRLSRNSRVQHIPYCNLGYRLVQLLALPDTSVGVPRMASIAGKPVTAVDLRVGVGLATATLAKQTWFFDPQTNLPAAVEYYEVDLIRGNRGSTLRSILGPYESVDGILVPTTVDLTTVSGTVLAHYQVSEVHHRQSLDGKTFDQK